MKTTTKYHFSTVQHSRDNVVSTWYETTFNGLTRFITEKGFKYTDNKHEVTMISPWLYKTPNDVTFEPARDADENLKLVDGRKQVRRSAANILGTDFFMLDYDGTMTIEQARERFKPYSYILYTTYSHRTHFKNNKDCFRIVLPLKEFLTAKFIESATTGIVDAFCSIDAIKADRSFITRSRCFFLPSCPTSMKREALMEVNVGTFFDGASLRKAIPSNIVVNTAPKIVYPPTNHTNLLNDLKQIKIRYEPTWTKLAAAMYGNDFTEDDYLEVTKYVMDQKTDAEARSKWRAAVKYGRPSNAGEIVNIIKQHGGTVTRPPRPSRPVQAAAPTVTYKKKRVVTV